MYDDLEEIAAIDEPCGIEEILVLLCFLLRSQRIERFEFPLLVDLVQLSADEVVITTEHDE